MSKKQPNDGQNPEDKNIGPGMSDSDFMEMLKKLPNNLGDVPMFGVPTAPADPDQCDCAACNGECGDMQEVPLDGVGRFDNFDLEDGHFSKDELESLARMLPSGGIFAVSPDDVREMALEKIYKLCGVFRRQYELRSYIEELGGDTNYDLVYSMLSMIGEASRLRMLIPKLEVDVDMGDDTEDVEEDEAA